MRLTLSVFVCLFIFDAREVVAQTTDGFMAHTRKTADALTDEKLNRFRVFWEARGEFSRKTTPSILRGLRDGGVNGAMAAATTPTNAQVFASAEEAAAAQSGLTAREGMALFLLLSPYYMGIYSAKNRTDVDVAARERDLASRREQFGRLYGAQVLAMVTRHEDQFVPLVAKQMEAYKVQMRAVGP